MNVAPEDKLDNNDVGEGSALKIFFNTSMVAQPMEIKNTHFGFAFPYKFVIALGIVMCTRASSMSHTPLTTNL